MRLIDRGKVMNDYLENLGRKDSYKAKYEALVKAVDEAPAIDAEPVRRGTWKPIHASIYPYGFDVKCTECGCAILGGVGGRGYNYCPNCGAKMDMEG